MNLSGKTIAITRSEEEAREFRELVESEGGTVIALQTIEIVPESPSIINEFLALVGEKKHDYCAFMSVQGVEVLFDLANHLNLKNSVISALNECSTVAVGPKTMDALKKYGVAVSGVPEKFSSAGLVDFFKGKDVKDKKIIIPRSGMANEFASISLSKLGMSVDEMVLYTIKTTSPDVVWKKFCCLLDERKIDAVVFTSASNVISFFEILSTISKPKIDMKKLLAISIGPFTSVELKKRNIKYYESAKHTIEGTFETVMQSI